jgi:hypothetical protein
MRTRIIQSRPALSLSVLTSLLVALVIAAVPVGAQGPTNGGFETGDLAGWTVGGLGAAVEVLQAASFTPAITPPEGTNFALLANGPGLINAANGPDIDGNTDADSDTATLSTTFTLGAAQVPAILSFQWAFLTSEAGVFSVDDFFEVRLNGGLILSGSVPGATPWSVSPYPDVPALDGTNYTVTSPGPTTGNTFSNGKTAFQTFNFIIASSGSYTLQFLVADQWNHIVDSGLLVDDVMLQHTLTVNKDGTGTGTVTSAPAGINCGTDCTEIYDWGTVVTLTAHPGVKSYVEWSGDCSGTGLTIQVTMDSDKTCIATFGYPVGGIVVPVSKLELAGPWMGLVALAGLAGLGVVVVRRRRG